MESKLSKQDKDFIRMYAALERITNYRTADQIIKQANKLYGLDSEEALQYSYENIQEEAKHGIKGVRIPKHLKPTTNAK